MLKITSFWDVTQCLRKSAFWRFEASYCLHRHDQAVHSHVSVECLTSKMNLLGSLETSENTRPKIQRHDQQHRKFQQPCKNLFYGFVYFWCDPPIVNSTPKSKHLDAETIKTSIIDTSKFRTSNLKPLLLWMTSINRCSQNLLSSRKWHIISFNL